MAVALPLPRLLLYNEIRGVVDKRRKRNALDDICDLVGLVVTRCGKQLHCGWIHSSIAGVGAGRVAYQHHRRPPYSRLGKLHTVCPA